VETVVRKLMTNFFSSNCFCF